MKTRMGFGLFLFVTLVGTGQGRDQSTRDSDNGYWWAKQSENLKLGFISGYVSDMTLVYNRTTIMCLAEKNLDLPPEKRLTDDVLNACAQTPMAMQSNFTGIRFGQLLEGVDDFYKDFRNKGVYVTAALFYVRDELKGKPAKELEDELNVFRHGPTPAKQ